MTSLSAKFRNLDAFSKAEDPDVMLLKTTSGAVVSSVSVVVMLLLLVSEFSFYRTTRTETHLAVDTGNAEDVSVIVDTHITFFHAQCANVQVRYRDHKGTEVDDARIITTRVPWVGDEDGRAVPNAAESDSNGCSVATTISVPKIAGEIMFTSNKQGPGTPFAFGGATLMLPGAAVFNTSHRVERLRFGPALPDQDVAANPLSGNAKYSPNADSAYDYFIQLVPTHLTTLSGQELSTLQYSATEFEHSMSKQGTHGGANIQPGVTFKFDFSPIAVKLKETRRTFLQFLTGVCAILGGVFALSGLVNNLVYRSGQLFTAATKPKVKSEH